MSTSLMNLTTSTPGVTNDLTAASNIESNWQVIDVHDHSSGKGTQVPTAGLNINAALNFSGNKAYNFLAAQFSNQTSSLSTASNKPCTYVLNGELRFIDNSGNDVQITNAGSVAGATGSISGLTAPVAAGFAANTFSWQANSGTGLYAKMSNADINLYEATAGITNAVTLKSYPSLAASYSVIFPSATPASTSYMTMSNTGQLATASADSIGQAMTSTGANAVSATRTRATGTTVAAGGVAISSGTGTLDLALNSATNTDVTNLTVTITTSGRPVMIALISGQANATAVSGGRIQSSTLTSPDMSIHFVRDSTHVSTIWIYNDATSVSDTIYWSPGQFWHIDTPSAGTYVYKVMAASTTATLYRFQDIKLIAYEL